MKKKTNSTVYSVNELARELGGGPMAMRELLEAV